MKISLAITAAVFAKLTIGAPYGSVCTSVDDHNEGPQKRQNVDWSFRLCRLAYKWTVYITNANVSQTRTHNALGRQIQNRALARRQLAKEISLMALLLDGSRDFSRKSVQ